MSLNSETIAAIATAHGRSGIGILRISGLETVKIALAVLNQLPQPRHACYCSFLNHDGSVIDQGIALYFPAPHSFTGEDVLELQGHGGWVVMDLLLKRVLSLGARMARPGEFSERAFLNNKIDLAQAEAISDLIDADSAQAARSALRSLQGEFSKRIHQLVESLIRLRMYVEAAIDFPEEEIDFLSDGKIAYELEQILNELTQVQKNAQQGSLLREGMTVVIAGRPNAGKSSLLNQLSGQETAIVTDIPGTTRDILREQIQIDGMPLHIIDTAGLRESADQVEQEGIRRAYREIQKADRILLVVDSTEMSNISLENLLTELFPQMPPAEKLTVIYNKLDLLDFPAQIKPQDDYYTLPISAKTGMGLDLLREHLKSCMGFTTATEGIFSARRRHLDALAISLEHLRKGQLQLSAYKAGELLAEELHQAQNALSEITGAFRADDLLGKIFSSFCIGK